MLSLYKILVLINLGIFKQDSWRGVSSIADNWTVQDYARRQLKLANLHIQALPKNSPALDFCQISYISAKSTLNAIAIGKLKTNRYDVLSLVEKFTKVKSA